MKCPRDVDRKCFDEMMECIPKGFVFMRSYRSSFSRHFVFKVKRKPKTPQEIPQGETFQTACPLK